MRPLSALVIAVLCFSSVALAEEGRKPLLKSHDPFAGARYRALRVPLGELETEEPHRAHPMLPALQYAYGRYRGMEGRIRSYRGMLIMRERIQGRLKPREYMTIKVRHRQVTEENQVVPFAVYLNFSAPKRTKGREVLFVEGENDGRMVATRGGKALSDITLWLKPDSERAMRGNHHPISDFGVLNLAKRLIEYGTEEMAIEASGDAKIRIIPDAKINKRVCTMVEVTHPQRVEGLRYHVARIFVDNEYEVPVRYAAYSWPPEEGDPPLLMEEYTYIDLELNVEFNATDFDPENTAYRFREARPPREETEAIAVPNSLAEASSPDDDK